MANQFQNGGYAVPKYVLAEPQGRATFTTKWPPRGTISKVPNDLRFPGWAVPRYAQGKYSGNPLTTKMLPRRTVSTLAPDMFSRPAEATSGTKAKADVLVAVGSSLDGSTLGDSMFGNSTLGGLAAPKKDPLVDFGKRGAAFIGREVMKLPKSEREKNLKELFFAISPGFGAEVEKKAAKYAAKGYKPKDAFGRAMAAALSNHLAEDLIKIGKGRSPSALALGAYEDLGWSLTGAVKSIGSGIASGAKSVGSFAKSGVKALGKLSCAVIKSPVGEIGGAAGGAALGGPQGAQAGMITVQAAGSVCPAGTKAISPSSNVSTTVPSSKGTFPIIPAAAAAGAALLLILLLKK